MADTQLDEVLRQFYAEARTSKGTCYSKSAVICIRSSINRHLTNPPFERKINIAQDSCFKGSNNMFLSIIRKMKRDGLDTSKHFPPISETDMDKLMSASALGPNGVFDTNDPKGLISKVWFDISINFARRGRENMRSLTKTSFELKTNSSQKEYFELTYNEFTKNHPATTTRNDCNTKPRMYGSENDWCPVKTLKKYLSKLNPGIDTLFQKPKLKAVIDKSRANNIWYEKKSLGVNTISNMMPTISKEAGLSIRYTNHSVRATPITLLSHAGVEAREIMRVSGHKNEASIKSYNTDSSDKQKRSYSKVLQRLDNKEHDEKNTTLMKMPQQMCGHLGISFQNKSISLSPKPNQGQFAFSNCKVQINNYY